MNISKADLFWNYGATFMRVASGVIVLPVILRMLPAEDVGLWSIMIGLNSMIYLLDFGFYQTFSRAITYIFSGAQSLLKEGFVPIVNEKEVNYPLLKGTLHAMRSLYGALSLFLLIIFFTIGIWYINRVLLGYQGDIVDAKRAWYIYSVLLCYQFYTYYFDALLIGRGLIKRSKQIIIFSQLFHIIISTILLFSGYGIISLVIGQSISTIINRYLAKRVFYDKELKKSLNSSSSNDWVEIIKTLFTTAYKSGLASLSWIFTNRMLAIFGALFLPITVIADYGISKQITDITITLSVVWFTTYYPKLTGKQVANEKKEVKRLYIKSQIVALFVFIVISVGTLLFGGILLDFIKSSTNLLPVGIMSLLFLASLFEALTYLSTSVLLSKNIVPHYKAQMITALFALVFLYLSLKWTNLGVLSLIVVPFVSQLIYQHWKWFSLLAKEMKITPKDYLNGVKSLFESINKIR